VVIGIWLAPCPKFCIGALDSTGCVLLFFFPLLASVTRLDQAIHNANLLISFICLQISIHNAEVSLLAHLELSLRSRVACRIAAALTSRWCPGRCWVASF
jgi:hypothetical protein